jgi:hypothetical protein
MNDFLYTVTDSKLNVFNIGNPNDPQFVNNVNVGWSIETIYPYKDRLFIGSQSEMFVYATTDPTHPNQLSAFAHVRSCDPVIAEDKYAYVTLRDGTQCQGYTNELDVLNIENLSNPQLLKVYPMKNPHGLAKDGSVLYICDGSDGVKVFDATDVNNLVLLKQIRNLTAYDVIAFNNQAMVVAEDGLYQFRYSNGEVKLLSKITFQN